MDDWTWSQDRKKCIAYCTSQIQKLADEQKALKKSLREVGYDASMYTEEEARAAFSSDREEAKAELANLDSRMKSYQETLDNTCPKLEDESDSSDNPANLEDVPDSSDNPGFFEHVSDLFNHLWEMLQESVVEIYGFEITWLHVVVAALITLTMMCIGYYVYRARRKLQRQKDQEVNPAPGNDLPPELDMV